ncbi:thioredoxin family protein [Streptomyces sp. NPDC051020]|uniref:DF family (seleno)protein n=1 Tax=Streptomyces sp. NPDC051020 TaxID=3155409 RepID=UPI0034150C1E
MDIELLYFGGCPNWHLAQEHLAQALAITGNPGHHVSLLAVETDEQAQALRFPGSPTIRVNGRDPFPAATETYGLTCRVYTTPQGLAGAPAVDELVRALNGEP